MTMANLYEPEAVKTGPSEAELAEKRRPREETIKQVEYFVTKIHPIDFLDSPAFQAITCGIHAGRSECFMFEEVHPDERHMIEIGKHFMEHHLYRIECGQKSRCTRVEFGLVKFPVTR